MAKHVFYIPASYTALVYSLLVGFGLLLSLYVGLCEHGKELLENACGPDHKEFWPSISSTIGDLQPERQIWRVAFVLCAPFRFGATITLFSVFWQKACRGMQDVYTLLHSPKQFLSSSACLVLLMLWSDLFRLIGAAVWTMVSSTEHFGYHNLGFGPYIGFGFILQITITVLVNRNKFNLNIYESQRDAQVSFRLKKLLTYGQTVSAMGVVVFNAYHKLTCYNGTYSLATMCEWVFALCNVVFDATSWYELKKEGWWLSGSPEFYRSLFSSHTGLPAASGDVNAPSSAIAAGSALAAAEEKDAPEAQSEASRRNPAAGSVSGPGYIAVHVDSAPQPKEGSDSNYANGVDGQLPSRVTMSASAAANHPTPSPPSATGEFFLTHDIILHRFTLCSAPSRLAMWLCDIYWAHLMFEMMVHVVEHMYFMPLIAMSLSWEMVSLVVLAAPCLLRLAPFRRWATGPCPLARGLLKPSHMPAGMHYRVVPMYVMFYFLACFSHLHLLIQTSSRSKILGVAYGPLMLLLGITCRYLYPSTASLKSALSENNEDCRRMLYAFPLGLVLGMLERICYISSSPMFTEPFYAAVFGIALGIGFTTIIYRHSMFGNAVKENPSVLLANSATAAGTSKAGGAVEGVPMKVEKNLSGEDAIDQSAMSNGAETQKRHVQFSFDEEDEAAGNTLFSLAMTYPAQHPCLLGVIMGLFTSLSITMYNCANYIPRLLAIDPYPASLSVVAAFALGLYYSVDVLPICPQIMTPRSRPGLVTRLLRSTFRQSFRRFGAVLLLCTVVMLYATRQTNLSYELPHKSYPVTFDTPREDVLIKYWGVQEDFWGSKQLAFLGGLGMTFCVGVLYPVAMELTLVHQRARRFALLADSVDPEQVFRREPSFLFSFEAGWALWTCIPSVIYALCTSYPFVPMAWLVREKTRPMTLLHITSLFLLVWIVARKMRSTRSTLVPNTNTARKQRSMQQFVAFLIIISAGCVVIGRTVLQPPDESFPAGKDTAIKYQDHVLRLHDMLVQLRFNRNVITDVNLKKHEVKYHNEQFEYAMEQMGKNVTADNTSTVDSKYGLENLTKNVRSDIWDAARAMTFFSGMIWTVHFALDNYNVDSLDRMVRQAKLTEAGVVGLLESDSMHLVNGNRDMVEYMSYYMGYRYTDYGPTALDNTYGCAMISRYPIVHVRRYVMPSPLGELACMIHAVLDVYGVHIHTYVSHFGNTEHFADGLLQSQFLGKTVQANPGPSLWLGYLVTFPGQQDKYHEYTDPSAPGKFRDTALELYVRHQWRRLQDRGGYEEEPPLTVTERPNEPVDFNVEAKLNTTFHLEKVIGTLDRSFRRTPVGKPLRHFYFNETNRYATAHPRFEFVDRYCQYNLYKTGAAEDEIPEHKEKLQPYTVQLFDWWRKVDGGVEKLSDTEIQVTQLRFKKRVD